jgi:hypothetical protein
VSIYITDTDLVLSRGDSRFLLQQLRQTYIYNMSLQYASSASVDTTVAGPAAAAATVAAKSGAGAGAKVSPGTHFTCFSSTLVQILTGEDVRGR